MAGTHLPWFGRRSTFWSKSTTVGSPYKIQTGWYWMGRIANEAWTRRPSQTELICLVCGHDSKKQPGPRANKNPMPTYEKWDSPFKSGNSLLTKGGLPVQKPQATHFLVPLDSTSARIPRLRSIWIRLTGGRSGGGDRCLRRSSSISWRSRARGKGEGAKRSPRIFLWAPEPSGPFSGRSSV